jgi:hypothetical protein
MRRLFSGSVVSAALICGCLTARADELYSMDRVKLASPGHLPATLVEMLKPLGFRVWSKDGEKKKVICEVFWVRQVSGQSAMTEDAAGPGRVLYGSVRAGALVGMVHFLVTESYVRDFRFVTLRPGYYTMRYAIMPKGVRENQRGDFVVLSPVSVERNAAHSPSLDELMRRGRLTSRTKRPAMMSLVEVDTDQRFPSLNTDDEGTSVLQDKLHLKPGKSGTGRDLPLALVVVTNIPEDLGD